MTKEEFENFCKCFFIPFSVDRQQAFFIGEQYGLTKADVMTIRKMAGFSSLNIKPKLTPAQREKIVKEYERGKISLHNLAKKYGVSRVCVWYWVKRLPNAGWSSRIHASASARAAKNGVRNRGSNIL